MSNILKAFMNIVNNPQFELVQFYSSRNRINNVGEALERYVQDAFAGTISETNELTRLEKIQEIYSYQGNQNNPPDLMLYGSDAIEVKKLQSKNSAIALNSSYPKSKLYADSPMITQACRECEEWSVKDIIYAIGHTTDTTLKSLWVTYGDCFCASKETYERIRTTISDGINTIPDVEFTETKELGKIKKVDPLGVTDLRIRGMWHIDNPNKIFNYIYEHDLSSEFELVVLIKKDKYSTLPEEDKNVIEQLDDNRVSVDDVKIKDPNNPARLLDAKLLVLKVCE